MTPRGRRSLALLVGTATLWATACGGGGGGGGDGGGDEPRSVETTRPPTPSTSTTVTTDVAIGPATTLPWWSAGRLHVGGQTISTPMRLVVTRGGTTIVGRATPTGSTWLIMRGHHLVPLVSTSSAGLQPVLSANGRRAAWTTSAVTRRHNLYEADETFTVTAYDVRRSRVVGSTTLESRTTCCDAGGVIGVAGVENDGTVVIQRNADRGWTWHPGSEPAELGPVVASGLQFADQWPGGVSWTVGRSSDDPAAFARVTPTGVVERLGRVPESQGGLWSADGTAYVFQPFSKFADYRPVVWSRGGHVVLHRRNVGAIVGWEDRHSLILLTRPRGGGSALRSVTLVRCNAVSGACEQAGPVLHHAVLPTLAG